MHAAPYDVPERDPERQWPGRPGYDAVGQGDIATDEPIVEQSDIDGDDAALQLGESWTSGFTSGFHRGRELARTEYRAEIEALDKRASRHEWIAQTALGLAVIVVCILVAYLLAR